MSSKAPAKKAKTTAKTASRKPKASWAETMKKALEKKQPPGGFPDQGKPRDSTVQKVRKNAF
ncbi:MAG TPA: hypothetical protein VGD45_22320 [Steroidobacter sp.]|uniref:hypothetical protein n=1 Tax=Steroidobacter sp. TaxID=1978227 RepID=UPI002ED7852D